MTSLEQRFAYVFADHNDRDCVSLDIYSPDGDFSLEFVTEEPGYPAAWNIAGYPPRRPTDGYDVLEEGTAFVTIGADVETPDEAAATARALITRVGGEDARIVGSETMRVARYPSIREATQRLAGAVKGVLP